MIRYVTIGLFASSMLLLAANAPAQRSRGDFEAARARAAARSGEPDDSGKSNQSRNSDEKDKDAGEKSSDVVDRPEKPDFKVDPSELDVEPIDGKVQFNFHGQPWQGVLEWLAEISGLSLDWQELPGDYLNLRTQRAYTLDEARDLINQHLLARGYTMLRHGEVLRVVKLDNLDPALVPHVEPPKFDERDKHEFVQTIFELDWLPAATAEQELKPLLSPHGKLTKLTTTNRLHAMDVVTNLIAIRDLLAEEQSDRGEARLVQSFQLQYARAEDVKSSLEDLLGLEQSGGSSGGDRDSRQMRMMREMQEQMRRMQRRGDEDAKPQQKEQKASIIANPRENAIIATAPPETMQIIERTVKLLDAPPNSATSFEAQLRRIKAYRLNEIDAETLTETLLDLGGFDPKTTITPDQDNSAIIVKGPIADHFVVQEVIEKLDGAVRQFKVIQLRRLPADYVAGTIRFMMGGAEEEEDNNDRYRWWDNDDDDEKTSAGQFRVDADVAGNQLLLYANPTEIEEINNLLIQLGEIRPRDGDGSTVRVLNLTDERAAEFLRNLEANWGADESHPLKIDPELLQDPAPSDKDEDANEGASEEESATPNADPVTPITVPTEAAAPAATSSRDKSSDAILAQTGAAHLMLQDELVPSETTPPPNSAENPAGIESDSPEDSSTKPTPVTIRRGPDGKLIVHSEDPRMLNIIEDLMYELAPPPKNYEVFKLEYPTTYMYDVVYNLEMYFEVGLFAEDEDDGNSSPFFFRWNDNQSEKETPLRLSERKELKFIPDPYTRTIIVQGATPEQLETIEELIKLYDQPQSQSSGDLRVTKIFSIEHAKAETIATAIKDVYRDLLSANDRAFQSRGGDRREGQRPVAEQSYTYVYGGGGDDNRNEPEEPIKFKGLLSIGVDEESNTLVISAAQALMGSIEILIQELDTAAKQQEAVSVVRTGPGGVPSGLSTKLKEIFGDKITIIGAEGEQQVPSNKEPVAAP